MPSRTRTYRVLGGTRRNDDVGGELRWRPKEVCLEYIPGARVGEYVVVHVGFAIQRLDEESARSTLAEFEHLGVLDEEFGDGFERAARAAGIEPKETES